MVRLNKLLDLGTPIYVATHNPNEKHWANIYGGSNFRFRVITGVDGRVVRVLGTEGVGLESAEWWQDAVMVGVGLTSLAAARGGKVVQALVRRAGYKAGETAFKGAATDAVLKEAAAAMASVGKREAVYTAESGMTRGHFEVFRAVAQKEGNHAVISVRLGKPAAIPYIEAGCPGKPPALKFKSNPKTGLLTATEAGHITEAHRHGYFVVDEALVAKRIVRGPDGREQVEELALHNPFWRLEKGQVIDPRLRKPVVGDYDLMGVIDLRSPGRNMMLVGSNAKAVQNPISPEVKRVMNAVNERMDQNRVLHAAQDQFLDLKDGGFQGGVINFYGDGTVEILRTQSEVEVFYRRIGRETIIGGYPRPAAGVPLPPGIPRIGGQR